MITMNQLCEKLGITRPTVYNYMRKGMPHRREWDGIRYKNMFDLAEVNKWIDRQREKRGA